MPVSRSAFRFFLHNAGYCTPPGRAACALSLAKAEAYAEAAGWSFRWEYDAHGHMCMRDHDEWCREGCRKEHEIEGCSVVDGRGEELASCWGIIDACRDYRRVMQAELASEAMADMPAAAFGIGKAA